MVTMRVMIDLIRDVLPQVTVGPKLEMSTGGSFARIAHRNKSSGNIYSGRNLPLCTFSRKKFLEKNFIRAKSSWLKTLFAQNIPLQCSYSRKIFLKSAGILFLARNINS